MSRRSVDSASESSRPSSAETKIRIPKAADMPESPASDARNEPLIDDFHARFIQPVARNHVPVSNNISTSSPGPEKDLPAAPTFLDDDEYGDDDSAPPDFSGRTRIVDTSRSNSPRQPSALPPSVTLHRNTNQLRKLRDSGSYIGSSLPSSPDYDRSQVDAESFRRRYSQESLAPSVTNLPALQNAGYVDDADRMEPLLEDDPANFDLVAAPPEEATGVHPLEQHAEHLFSREHLEAIFADRKALLKFTSFLNNFRPQSIPILILYLDALKALKAIRYANAIAESLKPIVGHDFTASPTQSTQNDELQQKADQAFDILVREDLPAYIAHTWISVVSTSIQRRITGTLAPHLREASEGLAEVFCLSDPSRKDNPIVFASEEFHRTTQYGMSYSIGRNCRFLQGPKTSPHSVRRLADACKAPKEHSEVFVNYRRDGSPFLNLLMIAPLFDSKGTLRYFIGAQVDVSGLLKEMTGMSALEQVIAHGEDKSRKDEERRHVKDEFQSLSEMFNTTELDTVRQYGGRMHRDQIDDDRESIMTSRPRLLLNDPTSEILDRSPSMSNADTAGVRFRQNGKLEGVYQHYLLVRPAPSLRILFTSPSLRVPGILQSSFLSRIGGSSRVRSELAQAFTEGRGVTAKIRWLTRVEDDGEDEGRSRWIHCTPLLGHNGAVGVWMVVLVDEEGSQSKRRFRQAPPVSQIIGGKEYDARALREKSEKEMARIEMMVPKDREMHSSHSADPRVWRPHSRLNRETSFGDATEGSYQFR